jgi:hypothetical protein
MTSNTSHLRADGTTFPPVTPDPPNPPGYASPLGDSVLDELDPEPGAPAAAPPEHG